MDLLIETVGYGYETKKAFHSYRLNKLPLFFNMSVGVVGDMEATSTLIILA